MRKSNKKNGIYKNSNKKGMNTMKKYNYEQLMKQIIEGQGAAQQNLVTILKFIFEAEGFNTDYLNNPFMSEAVKRTQNVEDLLLSWEHSPLGNIVDKAIEAAETSFNVFLALSCDEFNELDKIKQFTIFQQVLNFVAYHNHTDRVDFLTNLCVVAAKYKDTEDDLVSSRAWMLLVHLLFPELAA